MADAADSKSAGGNFVWVQVPLPAECAALYGAALFCLFKHQGSDL